MHAVADFFRAQSRSVRIFVLACLYAAVCMPVIVGSGFLFPFVFPKAVFFEAAVELALIGYLGLVFFGSEYRPAKSVMTVAVGAWIAAIALTTFLGVDASFSFWSKAERMDGLFWYLHAAAFFVMLVSVLRARADWMRFLQWNVIVSWGVGLVALLSKFAPSIAALGDQSRLAGTFGNPAFLATYFLCMLFLNALIAFSEEGKQFRWFWAAGSVFSLILVFLSGTRGAYVGILAGLFVWLFAMFLTSKGAYRKAALIGFLCLVVFAGSFVVLRPVWERVSPFLASRLYSIWEIPMPRLIVWQIGWEAFKARPLFGWGMENFIYAFDRYFIPNLHTYELSLFDRPHNKIIDLATSQGLIGLGAYLGIFCAIAWLTYRNMRKASVASGHAYALFLGLCVAYFVQDLVLFEMPSSGVVLFLMFAMAYWFLESTEPAVAAHVSSGSGFAPFAPWAWLLGIAAIGTAFFVGIVPPVQAGRGIVTAALSLNPQAGQPAQVLSYAKTAYDRTRDADTYLNKEVDVSMDRRLHDYIQAVPQASQDPAYASLAQDIAGNLEQDMKDYPLDYDVSLEYATALFELQQRAGIKEFHGATVGQILEHTITLGPKREDAYQYLFLIALQQGDAQSALAQVKTLLGLNDHLGLFWFYQAEYDARWGTRAQAYADLDQAKQRGYDMRADFAQWMQFAGSLELGKKYQDAVAEYQGMIKVPNLSSNSAFAAYLRMIEAQKSMGDVAGAHKTALEIIAQTQPQDRDALTNYLKNNGLW